jgi:purine-binding chemotaxis protein CheW
MMHFENDERATSADAEVARRQYLTFFLGGEEYGVPILRVRQIIELGAITRVPAAPACVRGVINLRGGVVPVADLAIRFGQPECVPTRFTCIVVVDVALDDELTLMGLMVDSVNQTMELADGDIEPPPSFGTQAGPELLLGMGKYGAKFVLLLDIDQALGSLERPADPAPEPVAASAGEPRGADA